MIDEPARSASTGKPRVLRRLRYREADPPQLPADVTRFLDDAEERIEAFFERKAKVARLGFFPSDYPLVFDTLRRVQKRHDEVRTFCEWGSGFGVVSGLAAFLGLEATGIELHPELVVASRRLLADHDLAVEIQEGSFIPESYVMPAYLLDPAHVTSFQIVDADGDVDVEIEDFDVVFAYPWPGEEVAYCDIFRRHAARGAILVTYNGLEGMRVRRRS